MGVPVQVHELMGVGKRYDLANDRDQRISVFVRKDGSREVYVFEGGGEEPVTTVALDEDEARVVAAILAGTYFAA